jgi:hypothetical protein
MHPTRVVLALLLAAVPLGGGPALGAPSSPIKPVESIASKVMAKLMAGDPAAAVARIHEPRAWEPARASADRRKVSEDLRVLLNEFGRISAPRVASDVTYFELQVAGADVPYWQALPNSGIDLRTTYRASFSKVGPGIVALTFTRVSGSWELRSISLGLDRSRPESKEAMVRIGRVFLRAVFPGRSHEEIESTLARIVGQPA